MSADPPSPRSGKQGAWRRADEAGRLTAVALTLIGAALGALSVILDRGGDDPDAAPPRPTATVTVSVAPGPTTSPPTDLPTAPGPTSTTREPTVPGVLQINSTDPPVILVIEAPSASQVPRQGGADVPAIITASAGAVVALTGAASGLVYILRRQPRAEEEEPPNLTQPPGT